MSESLIPQKLYSCLPKEIPHAVFVNHVLPFLGGVLPKQERLIGLQLILDEFLAQFTFLNERGWLLYHDMPSHHFSFFSSSSSHPDSLYRYNCSSDRHIILKDWTELFYLIKAEKNPEYEREIDYQFTVEDYFRYWVLTCEITVQHLIIFPKEAVLIYIQCHQPKDCKRREHIRIKIERPRIQEPVANTSIFNNVWNYLFGS
jgi:hypothetical protein